MYKIFIVPLHTVSINSFYYENKRHGIRTENREWQSRFMHALSTPEHRQAFAELREAFKPRAHEIHISIIAGMPELYNKQGEPSSRAHDCTNFEKPIVDLLCLPKYYGSNGVTELENLNIDDKFVTSVYSAKVHNSTSCLRITIRLKNTRKGIKA